MYYYVSAVSSVESRLRVFLSEEEIFTMLFYYSYKARFRLLPCLSTANVVNSRCTCTNSYSLLAEYAQSLSTVRHSYPLTRTSRRVTGVLQENSGIDM